MKQSKKSIVKLKQIVACIVFVFTAVLAKAENWEKLFFKGDFTYYISDKIVPSQTPRGEPTYLVKYKRVYTGADKKRFIYFKDYYTIYTFEVTADCKHLRQMEEQVYNIKGDLIESSRTELQMLTPGHYRDWSSFPNPGEKGVLPTIKNRFKDMVLTYSKTPKEVERLQRIRNEKK